MTRPWVVAAVVAAGLGAPQSAMADAEEAPPILVTASRTGAATGAVSTVLRERIAESQPGTLLDVLGEVPGVRAYTTGGPGGSSVLSVRGGEANFTVVLLDGVRLNDPTNAEGGAFDFTLLDPMAVDRIEVLRSAGSAVHGSDALGGVVQIATREPGRETVTAGASAWLDSRYGAAASATLSAGWGSGGLLVSGGGHDSRDGDPAGTLRRAQALVRVRQQFGGLTLDALGLYSDVAAKDFPQDSGGPLLAVNRTLEQRDSDLRLVSLRLHGDPAARLRPVLTFAHTVQHGDTDTPRIAPGVLSGVPAVTAQNRFERLEATGYLVAALGPATLSAGAAVLREDGHSDGTINFGFRLPVQFALIRVTHAGFAEASLQPVAGLTLNGAVRYDHLRGGAGTWTGQGGLRWAFGGSGSALFARIGNGFKQPSLYALGHPLIGDPALRPERSRTIEAGVILAEQGRSLAVTVFDNRYRDLIDFDPVRFRLTNRAQVATRGVELEASAELAPSLSLGGSVSYLDIASATPLRGRPAWSGQVRLGWQHGPWQALAKARWNGEFNDSSIPTGAVISPGHLALELGGGYRVSERFGLQVTLRNATDKRFQDAVGVPAPGRSVRLALTWE
jgi:vitamin B12 transporter